MTNKRIIGIDPGYDRVGWAISSPLDIRQKKIIGVGCIQTSVHQSIFDRYQEIIRQLELTLVEHQPEIAVIESLFFFKNHKTALRVSEARGIIISCLLKHNIRIIELTPLQIKQAVTGYGTADKQAVKKMVSLQLHITDTSLLDDAIDACACLLAGSVIR